MKKIIGHIILHMCTKNKNHMMYDSSEMSATDIIFCRLGSFSALLPIKNPKNQNFEKNGS